MRRIIKILIVPSIAIICLTACDKEVYVHYKVEGRIIDKITKEPIRDIMVAYYEHDLPNPEDREKKQKRSPIGHDGWSDENGKFDVLSRILDKYSYSLLYIYDCYGNGYKDTIISIDFSNVPLSGTPSKNYKGNYVLNIGDIELEKIE